MNHFTKLSRKNILSQDLQDQIFKNMSAEERLKVGDGLWRLAKHLTGDKINYGTQRPESSTHEHS